MSQWIVVTLLFTGALFVLLAAVGVLRMPDLFTRMQAATKAGTLGVGCILAAVMVYFGEFGVATRALMVLAFLFLTAPVAAHVIARAAYFVGVSKWKGTIRDDLEERYDLKTHALKSAATKDGQQD